jgi:hypothetical protein
VTGLWFSQGIPVSSTNKTDRHDIAEILLKVALNTIALNIELIVNMLYKFAVLEMKICLETLLNTV